MLSRQFYATKVLERYTEYIQSLNSIRRRFQGFWVTLPQLSASFIYSSVYEKLRNVLISSTGITSDQMVSALAGGSASICTQFVFVPTDIVAQYVSIIVTFKLIVSFQMMIHNQSANFTGSAKNAAVLDLLKTDNLKGRLTLGKFE